MDRLGAGNKETFAAKRAKQLKDWRLKVSGQGVNTALLGYLSPRRKLSATGIAANAAGHLSARLDAENISACFEFRFSRHPHPALVIERPQ